MTELDQEVRVTAGKHKVVEIEVLDESGLPVSLSGMTIKWAMGTDEKGTTILIEKDNIPITGHGGITITNAPLGLFEIALLPADTTGLHGRYYHEAEIINGTYIYSVTKGEFLVDPSMIVDP